MTFCKTTVISPTACYRGRVGRREEGRWEGGVGGSDRWEAGGGLNPSLVLFELAMGPRSASHRPKHAA